MHRQLGKTQWLEISYKCFTKINGDHYLMIRELHTKTIIKPSFDPTQTGKYINVLAYYFYDFAQNHSEAELPCQ